MNKLKVQELSQLVVPWTRIDPRRQKLTEEFRTSMTRLQEVLYDGWVAIDQWQIRIEPLLLLQPGQPVASLKPGIFLRPAVLICVCPTGCSLHDTCGSGDTGADRRSCAEQQYRLGTRFQ